VRSKKKRKENENEKKPRKNPQPVKMHPQRPPILADIGGTLFTLFRAAQTVDHLSRAGGRGRSFTAWRQRAC